MKTFLLFSKCAHINRNLCLQVPQSSQSLLRGKTAHDVAEAKKQRKALDEFKYYKSWDDSMSDVMKAVRSGDKDRVMQLISRAGEQIHYRDENNGETSIY